MTDKAPKRRLGVLPLAVAGVLLLAAFANRHVVLDDDPRMSPRELVQAMQTEDGPLVLDVRSGREFAAGHVPGAVHVAPRDLARFASTVPDRSEPLVLYCETGSRSRAARYALRDMGFTNLVQLEGDMTAWRRQGLPVARPGPAG